MTVKRTPSNERVKRRYLQFLREVKGRDGTSLDAVAKAIERFDEYNRRRDFKKFHIEQARGFKADLMEKRNARTGSHLSASTINSTLGILKAFFIWLAGETDYRARRQICRRGIFQCAGQSGESRDGAPAQALPDARANSNRS